MNISSDDFMDMNSNENSENSNNNSYMSNFEQNNHHSCEEDMKIGPDGICGIYDEKFPSKELSNRLAKKTNYYYYNTFKGESTEKCSKLKKSKISKKKFKEIINAQTNDSNVSDNSINNIDDSSAHNLNSEIKNNINLNNLPLDNSLSLNVINNNEFNSNSNINIIINNNSDSNNSASDCIHNSNQDNNNLKVNNSYKNKYINFKTETYEIRKSRKFNNDLQIKKHKGKFFRYIREILNQILIKYNIKAQFNFFPKILNEGPEKNTFKKILELKLIEFINFEIMEKITYKKGQKKIQISKKNKKLYEFLKDKQDIKFQIILKDLHNEYLKTIQYKKEINELEPHYDNEYMDLYKKNAEGFINYFFEDKKIKKHKKLKP